MKPPFQKERLVMNIETMLELYKKGLIPENLVKGFEKYTKVDPIRIGRMVILSFPMWSLGGLSGFILMGEGLYFTIRSQEALIVMSLHIFGAIILLASTAVFLWVMKIDNSGTAYYFARLIDNVAKELGISVELLIQRDLYALAERRLFQQAAVIEALQANPKTATSPKTKVEREEFGRIHHMFMTLGLVEEDWTRFFNGSSRVSPAN